MIQTHARGHPSLAAVRAFEAAARLGSFTQAAEELCLTQSAVSRHVRTLEDWFAVALFTRRGRQVALTEAGREYFVRVSDGLGRIRDANDAMLARVRRQDQVTLSLLPSVAALWLSPSLPDFTARHPGIDLRIHASRALADLRRDGIDLAMRYGQGGWPGVEAEPLGFETLTPICTPALAVRHGITADPASLVGAPLLMDDIPGGWPSWLRAAGLDACGMTYGPRFDEGASLYRAAAAGAGVALGRSLLVARDLEEGRLVAPVALAVPALCAYWLVWAEGQAQTRASLALADWLRERMRQSSCCDVPTAPAPSAPPPHRRAWRTGP
ncbi:transcriptional regulator GcvA [Azospirillum sp.]|uniref:transcriptional regulator GcvA n=1 Tax=Azospirillum sp. TaxID=34012 RepID=UPI003D72F1D1